jgi:hypothetical protein
MMIFPVRFHPANPSVGASQIVGNHDKATNPLWTPTAGGMVAALQKRVAFDWKTPYLQTTTPLT